MNSMEEAEKITRAVYTELRRLGVSFSAGALTPYVDWDRVEQQVAASVFLAMREIGK